MLSKAKGKIKLPQSAPRDSLFLITCFGSMKKRGVGLRLKHRTWEVRVWDSGMERKVSGGKVTREDM